MNLDYESIVARMRALGIERLRDGDLEIVLGPAPAAEPQPATGKERVQSKRKQAATDAAAIKAEKQRQLDVLLASTGTRILVQDEKD